MGISGEQSYTILHGSSMNPETMLSEPNLNALRFLSRAALAFLETPPEADIYQRINELLQEILPNAVLMLHSFDSATGLLQLRAISGLGSFSEKVLKLLGRDPVGMTFPINAEAREAFATGRLVRVRGGLATLALGRIPAPFCRALERLVDVDAAYTMGFIHGGQIFGNVVFITRRGAPQPDPGVIETLVHQAAIALKRRYAEESLRESEARYRMLADHASDVIWTINLELNFTYISPAIQQYGYTAEELLGCSLEQILLPESILIARDMLTEALLQEENQRLPGSSNTLELQVRCKDGSLAWVETNTRFLYDARGKPSGITGIGRNITERKQSEAERRRLEAQLFQAQKMESLGLLAGGIAHDFNNLLMAVITNTTLAREQMALDSPARTAVLYAEQAARRASSLADQILAYAGKGRIKTGSVNLSALVREMTALLESSLTKKVALRLELADDLPFIEADAAQIQQVVLNLILNAAEACAEKTGTVTIRTATMHASREILAQTHVNDALPAGEYITLTVTDTGCGMDAATRAKVFDPFFTTKVKGRGLGMAAVLGIVRSHRGAIQCRSKPGSGATFTVWFPRAASAAAKPAAMPQARQAPSDWQGSGAVLVVDDEQVIRETLATLLQMSGFEVLIAGDGYEAVERFRAHAGEIRAVLMDLNMPRLSGTEAALAIRQIRADVPIFLSSGYDADDTLQQFDRNLWAGFLHKPYDFDLLLSELQARLQPGGTSGARQDTAGVLR